MQILFLTDHAFAIQVYTINTIAPLLIRPHIAGQIFDFLMDEKIHIHIDSHEQACARGCCANKNPLVALITAETSSSKLSTSNWLHSIPLPAGVAKFDCVEVRFKNNHKDFFKIPTGIHVFAGDIVAVEASPGHDIGIVTLTGETARLQMIRKHVNCKKEDIKKLYRKAKQADVDKWLSAIEKEQQALFKTRVASSKLGLKMKVNDVEYQGDDTKAIFYYTADERVDFRELIKILAEELKIRIEMRQIGMRQEAGRLGGIGPCGRELCCATFITGFHSVSTTAARVQQLSLNPQKLAGQCSKLKCCLNYEVEAYMDAMKSFPDENVVLRTKKGDATLQKIDVFGRVLWFAYKVKEHEVMPISLEKAQELIKLNKEGKIPEGIEEFTQKADKKPALGLVVASEDLHRFDKKKHSNKKR